MKKTQLISKQSFIFLLFLTLFFQSCSTVKFVSDYDEITDRTVTDLQQKVTEYFVKLERAVQEEDTAGSKYENYIGFFDDAKTDITTLQVRANAAEKNSIVQKQIALLKENINSLESLHKIGFQSEEQLKPLENSFNTSFTAIIRFQNELKNGTK